MVTIYLPSELLLKEIKEKGTLDKPLIITLPTYSNQLRKFIASDKKDVLFTIQVPRVLHLNSQARMNYILDKKILQAASANKINIQVSVVDEEGREYYSWYFNGEQLSQAKAVKNNINLSLDLLSMKNAAKLNKNLLSYENREGFVITFSQKSSLPASATIRIYVGDQEGIVTGDKLYLYHYNSKKKTYEKIPNSSHYVVDKEGYITIETSNCNDILVLKQ